jgi:hippurate hydrolase
MNATLPPPALEAIRAHEAEMVAIRHQIHANPDLAYEEHATSDLVAERLARWGWEVHRGLGGTGVVGTLRAGSSTRRIGLRADMDALPIAETSGKPWASRVFGKMHACGHDGHTAMLLSAARHLAATREFDGIVHAVFQPAEEGLAGARKMLEDGFLDLFPCDVMFGMHNAPGVPEGALAGASGVRKVGGGRIREVLIDESMYIHVFTSRAAPARMYTYTHPTRLAEHRHGPHQTVQERQLSGRPDSV